MAIKALGTWTEKNANLSRTIKAYMKMTETDREKIVKKAHISLPTFYKHLHDPDKMTIGEFRAYIDTLKIPKENILDALYLDKEILK